MWQAKQLVITSAQIAVCLGLAQYEIFSGFDDNPDGPQVNFTTSTEFPALTNRVPTYATFKSVLRDANTTATSGTNSISGSRRSKARTRKYRLVKRKNSLNPNKLSCPEAERPSNIGPYEVPTQLDMVAYTKSTMRRIFERYHLKITILLDDFDQATRASSQLESTCKSPGLYRKCVRNVDTLSKGVAKSYLASVKMMRDEVNRLSEDSVCNLSSMKGDPVKLIESLAMQEASLDFVLPGFLRLLNTCSIYCSAASAFTKSKSVFLSVSEDPAITQFLNPKLYTTRIK